MPNRFPPPCGGRRRRRRRSPEAGFAIRAQARSVDEILSDSSIGAVLVATSTDTHSDLIEHATAAGKAVLCEKPVDLALERALQCQAKVAPTGMQVMIGFNRRFAPNFAALKSAFDRRDRQGRTPVDHVFRPGSAAFVFREGIRRPVPRHDDPRLRYRMLDHGQPTGEGDGRRVLDRRPRDRSSRRC
jgi:hypothetical protein